MRVSSFATVIARWNAGADRIIGWSSRRGNSASTRVARSCPDIDEESLRAELRAIGDGGHGAADTLALYWDLRADARIVPVEALDRLAAHPARADEVPVSCGTMTRRG